MRLEERANRGLGDGGGGRAQNEAKGEPGPFGKASRRGWEEWRLEADGPDARK